MGTCGDYLNTRETLKLILKHTKDSIEKLYLDDRYNDILKTFLNDFKNYMNPNKPNQFAFIIFIKKDGTLDTEYLKEYFPDSDNNIHSEDYIFDILKEILDKNDCPYKEALVFSTNSLCSARKKCKSCMSQAIYIAEKLYKKHKMKLIIGFYKPWGISGPYASILPYKPLKDCTYTFESQTLRSNDIIISKEEKKTTNNIDNGLLELLEELIYKNIIPAVQHKTFLMEGNITKDNKPKSNRTKDDIPKPEYNLEQFYSKIYDLKKKEKLAQIVSSLFEH